MPISPSPEDLYRVPTDYAGTLTNSNPFTSLSALFAQPRQRQQPADQQQQPDTTNWAIGVDPVPYARAPFSAGAGSDPRGLVPYIRETATKYGIDPNTAVRVARSEGLSDPVGDQGRSFGAFQLFTGGGLGNEFKRDTGLDPSDPANEKATIDYALRRASEGGWGPWHGASAIGLGTWTGIK